MRKEYKLKNSEEKACESNAQEQNGNTSEAQAHEKDSSKSHTRCFKKCCLKKGHELNIKCSFNNCQCNCVCDCICSKFSSTR